MIRRIVVGAGAVGCAAALAACTSSTSGPSTPSSSPGTASKVAARSGVPSAGPSPTPTCAAGATHLTYHRHAIVVSGENYSLAPTSSATFHGALEAVTSVRASAPGLGTGAGVLEKLDKHWHTVAEPFGVMSAVADREQSTTLRNTGRTNRTYAVYRRADVYTGTFTASCSGKPVHGHYTTFGPLKAAFYGCTNPPRSRLDRIAKREFCG